MAALKGLLFSSLNDFQVLSSFKPRPLRRGTAPGGRCWGLHFPVGESQFLEVKQNLPGGTHHWQHGARPALSPRTRGLWERTHWGEDVVPAQRVWFPPKGLWVSGGVPLGVMAGQRWFRTWGKLTVSATCGSLCGSLPVQLAAASSLPWPPPAMGRAPIQPSTFPLPDKHFSHHWLLIMFLLHRESHGTSDKLRVFLHNLLYSFLQGLS